MAIQFSKSTVLLYMFHFVIKATSHLFKTAVYSQDGWQQLCAGHVSGNLNVKTLKRYGTQGGEGQHRIYRM